MCACTGYLKNCVPGLGAWEANIYQREELATNRSEREILQLLTALHVA